jgi:toxin ParE1/3/4
LNSLTWKQMAIDDREAIMEFIAKRDPTAAIKLDGDFEAHAEKARLNPHMYKAGRVTGTHEIVVRKNYVMVYRITSNVVEVLRVLHAQQKWPP